MTMPPVFNAFAVQYLERLLDDRRTNAVLRVECWISRWGVYMYRRVVIGGDQPVVMLVFSMLKDRARVLVMSWWWWWWWCRGVFSSRWGAWWNGTHGVVRLSDAYPIDDELLAPVVMASRVLPLLLWSRCDCEPSHFLDPTLARYGPPWSFVGIYVLEPCSTSLSLLLFLARLFFLYLPLFLPHFLSPFGTAHNHSPKAFATAAAYNLMWVRWNCIGVV